MSQHRVDALRAFSRRTVVFAVVLSPWLFGSADPWAYLCVGLIVNLGVFAWLLALVFAPPVRLRAPWVALALVMLLGFVMLQAVPLPRGAVSVLGPMSYRAQQTRAEAFDRIEAQQWLPAGMPAGGAWTLSASPAATWRSFGLLAAYVGAFVVIAHEVRTRRQLAGLAGVLVGSAFVMAVLGMAHEFSGSRSILWFHRPRFGGAIFGPFTNPNHYAAYMNMAFGVALGALLMGLRRTGPRARSTASARVAWLSSRRANQTLVLSFAAVAMGASVFVSLSRGGITTLAAAVGLVGLVASLRVEGARRARLVGAVALMVVASLVWLGWGPVVRELGGLAEIARDPVSNVRTMATADTLRVFRDAPVFGSGFGSFQFVFPAYQREAIRMGGKRWLHAHNDYAQLLAEGGLVGALLWAMAVVAFVWYLREKLREDADAKSGSTVAEDGRQMLGGLCVAIGAISLHSAIDYSLHKPAVALMLATVCGMCVAAVNLRVPKSERGSSESDGAQRAESSERERDVCSPC